MVFHETPKTFPPGRQPLPQEFREAYKRERVALAVARLVCRVGVEGLTVSLIVSEAKMARATFYQLFDNREMAVEYAIGFGNEGLRNGIDDVAGSVGGWRQRVEAVIGHLLDVAAADRELIELCLLHGQGAGSYAGPFDPDLVQALIGVLRAGRAEGPGPAPPPRIEELLTYAILSVISDRVRRGRAEALPDLGAELSELAILPFLGCGSQSVGATSPPARGRWRPPQRPSLSA